MIKAIVYTSNTGFTKEYAEMLSESLNVPAYEFSKAKKTLNKKDEICYMGWIMAGGIKNYEKARKIYNIKAVCAVGMSYPYEKLNRELKERHHIKENLYYLQGGYDKSKLKGIYKLMMNVMESILKSKILESEKKSKEDEDMIEMITVGKSCVSKDNLKEVIDYLNK